MILISLLFNVLLSFAYQGIICQDVCFNRKIVYEVDSIELEKLKYAEIKQDSARIILDIDQLYLNNQDLDSILYQITNYIKDPSNIIFYVTFAHRNENEMIIEVMMSFTNQGLLRKNRDGKWAPVGDNRTLYGCFRYRNMDFYVLLYQDDNYSDVITPELQNKFFQKDGTQISIQKIDSPYLIRLDETPIWYYQYYDDKIYFLSSYGNLPD